jgi:hypothetical protein
MERRSTCRIEHRVNKRGANSGKDARPWGGGGTKKNPKKKQKHPRVFQERPKLGREKQREKRRGESKATGTEAGRRGRGNGKLWGLT